jgi:hypothetical protein
MTRVELLEENARLREDAKRLSWLEYNVLFMNAFGDWCMHAGVLTRGVGDLRTAIDRARETIHA